MVAKNRQGNAHLVSIFLCKIKDELPPLSGGIGGIKNLTDDI